jgi:hypothetical protein
MATGRNSEIAKADGFPIQARLWLEWEFFRGIENENKFQNYGKASNAALLISIPPGVVT